jgi:phosphopantetheinyl transferase (holo-ACP synthase)
MSLLIKSLEAAKKALNNKSDEQFEAEYLKIRSGKGPNICDVLNEKFTPYSELEQILLSEKIHYKLRVSISADEKLATAVFCCMDSGNFDDIATAA